MRALNRKDLVIAGATLTLITYTLILSVTGQALSDFQTSKTVPSAGEVRAIGVGIYWDSSCLNDVSSIDWGTLEPGSTKSVTCYIQNEGNTPSTLSLQTSNWNPSGAATYMNLTWDYNGQALSADEIVKVTLTLSIAETIEGITSYSFDITIIGSA